MEYSTLGGVILESLRVLKLSQDDQSGFREKFKTNTKISQ